MIVYVDSSVVLRRVLQQPGALPDSSLAGTPVASALVEVECFRTLDRMRLRSLLSDPEMAKVRGAVLRVLSRLELIAVSTGILRRAAEPFPTKLATLDAIHLSSALLVAAERAATVTVATHDRELAIAARSCGLPVLGCD